MCCIKKYVHFLQGPVIIASSQGGVNIEEVAAENPDAILYEPIDITKGITKQQAEDIAVRVGLKSKKEQTGDMLMKMYDLFLKKDALLIEINPYAEDAGETCELTFDIFLTVFCFTHLCTKCILLLKL